MRDHLPEDWSQTPLGELFEMQLGKMLSQEASNGPWQARYLANRHVQWDRVMLDHLDTMSFNPTERQRFELRPGDLLVCEGGEVGRTAQWHGELPGIFFQKAVHRLRPLNGRIEPGYMLRFMRRAADTGAFTDLASQTSIAHLTREKLALLSVPTPPLPEQRQIAAILDTIDETIRKTEQIIAKLKQVKQGLLHDLLTRGIDDNGELRDPERHPEQFKDSVLGRIPRGWEVVEIAKLLAHIIDYRGRTPKKLGMDWGGSIPALSANNVKMGAIDLSEPTYYGSSALYARWMTNGACEPGDVLMTMEAPLGNVAQIPDAQRYILSQRVVLYRFSPEIMVNDFAALQMRSASFQAALVERSTGTTATGIQRARLIRMPMLLPPVNEQLRIVDAVRSSETRLETEASGLRKLRLLKSGLMEDLLTGRVRVSVAEVAS
jgi:type I restriction enzyme S subunit